MKRTLAAFGIGAVGVVVGIAVSEFIYRSAPCRDAIGQLFGRGQLLALVAGHGVYEIDLQSEAEADSYLAGLVSSAANQTQNRALRDQLLKRLIANENLRQISSKEAVSGAELERELKLLRFQFLNEKAWTNAIGGISESFLREQGRAHLRARTWINRETGRVAIADEASCRAYYEAHLADFAQPLRLRASHLFLAAPPVTPREMVEAKRHLMDSLILRMANGEQFAQLAQEASEDEATKPLGGDLNYFASWRVPAEFFAAVSQMKIGETSKPIRSPLGFHLVQLAELKPLRQLPFEEARLEIARFLTNSTRQTAVQRLSQEMNNRAWYLAQ